MASPDRRVLHVEHDPEPRGDAEIAFPRIVRHSDWNSASVSADDAKEEIVDVQIGRERDPPADDRVVRFRR